MGVSGGVPLGSIKWNYDLSITNGFSLLSDGQLTNVNLSANSRNKTYTGRLGLLPLSNNSLEIGVSGMTGGLANGDVQFQNPRLSMYAFDLNYVKNIQGLQVNVKGQYNFVNISSQSYTSPTYTTQKYSFTNSTISGYQQLSLRLIGAKHQVIKNLEVACRYGTYNTPFNSLWGNNLTQLDYGVNYWINWRTVVRVSYEVIDSKSPLTHF